MVAYVLRRAAIGIVNVSNVSPTGLLRSSQEWFPSKQTFGARRTVRLVEKDDLSAGTPGKTAPPPPGSRLPRKVTDWVRMMVCVVWQANGTRLRHCCMVRCTGHGRLDGHPHGDAEEEDDAFHRPCAANRLIVIVNASRPSQPSVRPGYT
jgi:hypothetical protein